MMPEIIAHRGASYLAPENTLTAFRKAMEIGADGVEMDVQQTGDKKLVIHHDFLIDWHTDMRGQIYDMTEGELKALDFGSWKDVSYKDERIATLQEALALCREMEGTVVQLELKATIDNDPDFVPRVIEEIRAADITDRLVVISFNHDLLRQAKQVYCMGQGGSMVVADEICARFACVTNKFRATGDSHMQIMAASLMTPQDVVLFVSYSGATRDMMETLRTAKDAGAKIILLTHYEDSPGALLADVVLLCGAQESPLDSGSIPIKVAVLYVAEVLVLRYILDDKPGSTKAQERTTEALAVKLL